jgi:tetratricopeptide (TPR) repeat protein
MTLKPSFQVEPAEVLAISASLPPSTKYPVTELLEEDVISVDDQGRRTHRYRYVFRIDREAAIEGWGVVQAAWSPWLEEKPTLRARVITAAGREVPMDPSTVVEFQAEKGRSLIFTDRMMLKAPLPELAVGAVVEVETVSKEHRPFSTSGVSGTVGLTPSVPVHEVRFELEAPAKLGVEMRILGLPKEKLHRKVVGSRVQYLVELEDTLPPPPREPLQPPEERPYPRVVYGSAKSWGTVAAEYLTLVEGQLKGAELEALAHQAVTGAKAREVVLSRLLEQLHRSVRYVAFEFGAGSIVPRRPDETLKRGYGDCKDKSVLLVALLRAAGMDARVALLRTGPGEDVTAELPGLSGFDHAIVYLPGPKPMWIDPTAQYFRAGELPVQDQRRLALIVSPHSTALVKTPGMTVEESTTVETRDVRFDAFGPAELTETTEGRGYADASLREDYAETGPKQLKENLTRYVTEGYKAKELGAFELSDPKDLEKPFRLTLTAKKVGIASTSQVDAAISMNPWPLVTRLQSALKPGPAGDDDANGEAKVEGAAKKADPKRKSELEFPAPWAHEYRWVLHVPPGFAADALPEDRTTHFGPATLSESYRASPEGVVTVVQRFELKQLRWSASEVDAAREALKAFGEDKIPVLAFQQVGEAHLSAGRLKEALVEFRRLNSTEAGSATDLTRLARAQLAGGLGASARASATKATQLAPSDGRTFQTLGWVLQHDTLGRRFKPGWDRKGALAAYRKTLELDPSNRDAAMDLAILLEHDLEGERYATGAELDESIQLYQRLIDEEKSDTIQDNLMVCLARRGRFEEALKMTRDRAPGARRNGWLVAMLVTTKGFDAAKLEAAQFFQDLATRRGAFLVAAEVLIHFRRYAESAKLLELGATDSTQMAQIRARAELLARVHNQDQVSLNPTEPRSVVLELLRGFLSSQTPEKLSTLMTPAQRAVAKREDMLDAVRKVKALFLISGLPRSVAMDLGLSLVQIGQEGDDQHGYKVRLRPEGSKPVTFYVARQGKGYALVGSEIADLGREALWKAEHGNLEEARSWLDEAMELIAAPKDDDSLSGHAAYHLWKRRKEGAADEVKAAAVVLMGPDTKEDLAFSVLKAMSEAAQAEPQRSSLRRALYVAGLKRRDWPLVKRVAGQLLESHPDSLTAQLGWTSALMGSGQVEEALGFLEKELANHPTQDQLFSAKVDALGRLKRFPVVEALLLQRIGTGKTNGWHYNHLAWTQVVLEKVTTQTLESARLAVQAFAQSNRGSLHTLATVLAESDRTAEARETIIKAIDLAGGESPRPVDWYVFGRIAEQLGEPGEAVECYRKVLADAEPMLDREDSTAALAARRLKAMGQLAARP